MSLVPESCSVQFSCATQFLAGYIFVIFTWLSFHLSIYDSTQSIVNRHYVGITFGQIDHSNHWLFVATGRDESFNVISRLVWCEVQQRKALFCIDKFVLNWSQFLFCFPILKICNSNDVWKVMFERFLAIHCENKVPFYTDDWKFLCYQIYVFKHDDEELHRLFCIGSDINKSLTDRKGNNEIIDSRLDFSSTTLSFVSVYIKSSIGCSFHLGGKFWRRQFNWFKRRLGQYSRNSTKRLNAIIAFSLPKLINNKSYGGSFNICLLDTRNFWRDYPGEVFIFRSSYDWNGHFEVQVDFQSIWTEKTSSKSCKHLLQKFDQRRWSIILRFIHEFHLLPFSLFLISCPCRVIWPPNLPCAIAKHRIERFSFHEIATTNSFKVSEVGITNCCNYIFDFPTCWYAL